MQAGLQPRGIRLNTNGPKKHHARAMRDAQLLRDWEQGASYGTLSGKYSLSRQRVVQIVQRHTSPEVFQASVAARKARSAAAQSIRERAAASHKDAQAKKAALKNAVVTELVRRVCVSGTSVSNTIQAYLAEAPNVPWSFDYLVNCVRLRLRGFQTPTAKQAARLKRIETVRELWRQGHPPHRIARYLRESGEDPTITPAWINQNRHLF